MEVLNKPAALGARARPQAEARSLEAEQRAWAEGRREREELLRREGELRAEAERLQVGGQATVFIRLIIILYLLIIHQYR